MIPTTYPHCLFILLDGARPDVLGTLLGQGLMPNFFEVFVRQGLFTRATSAYPSTTGPAYLPYLTGMFPGHCNVPGIRWFDRKAYAAGWGLNRFRSYVGIESYFFNSDITPNIPTLFELVKKPMNIFSCVNKGAGFFGNRTRFTRAFYALYAHFTEKWEHIDQFITLETQAALKQKPDFLFTVFPAIDKLSHHSDPFSDRVICAYIQFDEELGKILDTLEREHMREKTLLVLASDHGLSATHTHCDLVKVLEQNSFKTFFYPKIFKKDFNLAVMQSGNAMAHLYLKSGHGWEERNLTHDLYTLIDLLSGRPEIAWVASLDRDGRIYVRSHDGEAWIKAENGKIFYKSVGEDPFGLKKPKPVMTLQESLEYTFYEQYPDAFVQLCQLFESSRCGDLVINAKEGFDLRLDYEWPEHHSSHGSLILDHMHVPVAISHPIQLDRKIRSVDLFPTLLQLLGIPQKGECDGLSMACERPIFKLAAN